MTPAEELAVVRARLERMVTLVEALRTAQAGYSERGIDSEYAAFIAAASPDLLVRLAREALYVLNWHRNTASNACLWCDLAWPCVDAAGVLRAWQP